MMYVILFDPNSFSINDMPDPADADDSNLLLKSKFNVLYASDGMFYTCILFQLSPVGRSVTKYHTSKVYYHCGCLAMHRTHRTV